MRTKIKVNPKTGVFYMPKDLLSDGFKGEMDALSNAMTFTIIHPEMLSKLLRKVTLKPLAILENHANSRP